MTVYEELIKRTQTEAEIASIANRLCEIVKDFRIGVHVDVSLGQLGPVTSVYLFPEGDDATCISFHLKEGDELLGAIEKAKNQQAEASL